MDQLLAQFLSTLCLKVDSLEPFEVPFLLVMKAKCFECNHCGNFGLFVWTPYAFCWLLEGVHSKMVQSLSNFLAQENRVFLSLCGQIESFYFCLETWIHVTWRLDSTWRICFLRYLCGASWWKVNEHRMRVENTSLQGTEKTKRMFGNSHWNQEYNVWLSPDCLTTVMAQFGALRNQSPGEMGCLVVTASGVTVKHKIPFREVAYWECHTGSQRDVWLRKTTTDSLYQVHCETQNSTPRKKLFWSEFRNERKKRNFFRERISLLQFCAFHTVPWSMTLVFHIKHITRHRWICAWLIVINLVRLMSVFGLITMYLFGKRRSTARCLSWIQWSTAMSLDR